MALRAAREQRLERNTAVTANVLGGSWVVRVVISRVMTYR